MPNINAQQAVLAAGGLGSYLAQAAPDLWHLPDAPYAWMYISALGAWYARRAFDSGLRRPPGGARQPGARRRRQPRPDHEGVADAWEYRNRLGAATARTKGRVTRPGLTVTRQTPLPQIAIRLGAPAGIRRWSVQGLAVRSGVWSSLEDPVLLLGRSRSGKSGYLATLVEEAPGAAVVTSTRTDLYNNTARVRAASGPVMVLNTDRLGGIPTTLRWDPLTGCSDPAQSTDRAGYLMAAVTAGANTGEAGVLLRLLLHAAALTGGTIYDVYSWALQLRHAQIPEAPYNVLRTHPAAASGWAVQLAGALSDPAREQAAGLVTAALDWLSDPGMEQVVTPGPGCFDMAEFVARRGTVYLIGAHRPHTTQAGFLAAFFAHLVDAGKQLAAASPGTRLDPPVTLALDEAASISPIPLHQWVTHLGGWGYLLLIGVQSWSQLADRWGEDGGRTIWNNTIKLVFGGFTDPQDLEDLSLLCGQQTVPVTAPDGTQHERTEPTFPPERIRLIGEQQALLLHPRTRPGLLCVPFVWDRPSHQPVISPPAQAALPAPQTPAELDAPVPAVR
ncbi:type IV secretory system conjugative DNA transfer family protein [Actinomadura sp. 3N407]|uniref:type IV secretory system conjugative DNA transfer family protein n=1 Tax=Actinomadura sp. 3N407 TaxID=3457423 RepID=UPI003FCD5124